MNLFRHICATGLLYPSLLDIPHNIVCETYDVEEKAVDRSTKWKGDQYLSPLRRRDTRWRAGICVVAFRVHRYR